MILYYPRWTEVDRDWWFRQWPNFAPDELACRGTGLLAISEDFLEDLQELRDALNQPMHVTSGCRSSEYNFAVGGKSKSFHVGDSINRVGAELGCLAVDIAATDGAYRGRLFALAWEHGWTIGWNARRKFLHLDRRVDAGWRQTSFDYA